LYCRTFYGSETLIFMIQLVESLQLINVTQFKKIIFSLLVYFLFFIIILKIQKFHTLLWISFSNYFFKF